MGCKTRIVVIAALLMVGPAWAEAREAGGLGAPEIQFATLVEPDGTTRTAATFVWPDREVSRIWVAPPGERPPLLKTMAGAVWVGRLLEDGDPVNGLTDDEGPLGKHGNGDCCQCFGCDQGGLCSRDMGSMTCSGVCDRSGGCVCIECWLGCKAARADHVDKDGILWTRVDGDARKSGGCQISQ